MRQGCNKLPGPYHGLTPQTASLLRLHHILIHHLCACTQKRGVQRAFALTESYMDGDVYAHTYARIDAYTPTRPYTQLHMYVSMQVMTSYTHAFTLHPKTLPHTLLPHTPHSHIYTPLNLDLTQRNTRKQTSSRRWSDRYLPICACSTCSICGVARCALHT